MPKIFLPGVQPFYYTNFVSYSAPELSFLVLKISGRNQHPSTPVCHRIRWVGEGIHYPLAKIVKQIILR